MAKVFISHSSKDKAVAVRLKNDLIGLAHETWIDSDNILIGDSITGEIARGLDDCHFLLLLLSPNSVESGWVEKEWQAKYWDEASQKRVVILTAMVADCKVPTLLKDKKFADLRGDAYATGLAQLHMRLVKDGPGIVVTAAPVNAPKPKVDLRIPQLLARVQDPATKLSVCFAQALELGIELGDDRLRELCAKEIRGYGTGTGRYDKSDPAYPAHRVVEMFVTYTAEINSWFVGWGGDMSNAIEAMKRDTDNFTPISFMIGEPIAQIEIYANQSKPKSLIIQSMKAKTLIPSVTSDELELRMYARWDSYLSMVERARARLTDELLRLLPFAPG